VFSVFAMSGSTSNDAAIMEMKNHNVEANPSELQKTAAWTKYQVLFILLLVFSVFGILTGLNIASFNLAKETHVRDGVLTGADGHTPVATASVVHNELVQYLFVSSPSGLATLIGAPFTYDDSGPEGSVTHTKMIIGVEKHHDFNVSITFADGAGIYVTMSKPEDRHDRRLTAAIKNIQKALTARILKRLDDGQPLVEVARKMKAIEGMQPQINDMERRLGIMQSVEPVLENAIKTLQKVVDVRGMGKK